MISYVWKLKLLLMDIMLINVAFIISLLLRFDGKIDPTYSALYKESYLVLTLVMLLSFLVFDLYKSLWRYASIREMVQVIGATVVGVAGLIGVGHFFGAMFPRSVYIIYIFILTVVMIGSRFSYRFLKNGLKYSKYYANKFTHPSCDVLRQKVMIIGAGEAASIVIKDLHRDQMEKHIVVVLDDDKGKLHSNLHGVPIKGDTSMIGQIAKDYEIDEIIIAIPSASKKKTAQVATLCSQTEAKLKIFPGIEGAISSRGKQRIRPVRIEDLLGREEITIDNDKLQDILKNKTIVVTGGGGSIGSELCRQILEFNPGKVVVFDIYENNAYDLQNELINKGIPKHKVDIIIGSVRDKEKLRQVFGHYKPSIVFHAAAHKHVPLMEFNPEEAIKNNVFGTLNAAQSAMEFKVDKFILISTDKAVNPTNVMGATKRLCEMIIQSINDVSDHTEFAAVRFGNVLGSNGSVIPLFKRQLEAGGPITITHPDIIRYFMTIPEAIRLILEANTFAQGGEIFVLDMGEPVKIVDLAKNLIKLSGFKEGIDMEIAYVGLRPGEKLFEELLMEEEGLVKTSSDKIFVAKPAGISYKILNRQIQRLGNNLDKGGDIRELLREIVPTYTPHIKEDQQEAI